MRVRMRVYVSLYKFGAGLRANSFETDSSLAMNGNQCLPLDEEKS